MSDALTPDELAAALAALPGWEEGADGLERTVPAATEDQETLTDAIAAVGQEVGRSARTTATADGLHISLGTSAGTVTKADVELATRLDRLLSGGVAWSDY